jgi:hypothetical protein
MIEPGDIFHPRDLREERREMEAKELDEREEEGKRETERGKQVETVSEFREGGRQENNWTDGQRILEIGLLNKCWDHSKISKSILLQ